ncbi:hypothetical protein HDV57DRAFT_498777 [Trichoderma longibrachiatum]
MKRILLRYLFVILCAKTQQALRSSYSLHLSDASEACAVRTASYVGGSPPPQSSKEQHARTGAHIISDWMQAAWSREQQAK